MPVAHAVKVAAELLSALGAAHDAGIVHRDVKPGNVMLADDCQVLLTDFGIAVHQADTALTVGDGVIGSIEYIAPERARGADAQAASDLSSLGPTLYQALEGVSPFRRDTPTATLAAILLDEPPAPRRSGELAQLIIRLLAKDPLQRPTVPAAEAMVDGMSHGMGSTAVVTVPELAVAAPELGAATVPGPEPSRDVAADCEPAAPASAKAARVLTPRLPAGGAALREEVPAPGTAAAPDRRTSRPKRVRVAAVSGAIIVVIVAIGVSLALWGPGHHAPDPLDGLRDPCKTVSQSELNPLGLASVTPTHHTENVDSSDRWCEWDVQADARLTVGYGTRARSICWPGIPKPCRLAASRVHTST
ncbi:serine/threonine-protein kinase [Streptomyces sp. NPDC059262]|uniref:serine/threonine-protein kinase n=1 Tax=Streptomyces sp. NPDC059262 TaxID=3346797 RepID=UPI0036CC17D5